MDQVNHQEKIENYLQEISTNLKRLADLQEPPKPAKWVEGEPPIKDASRRFMGGRFPPMSGNHYHGKPELKREYNSARSVRSPNKR